MFSSNWYGPDVCSYNGVFCAPALDNPCIKTVAGIDLNHQNIAGSLPRELGLLTDFALFHINSKRFCGTVPEAFKNLRLLFELDISNNRFAGKFPSVVLCLPSLKFLDIRFNKFEGKVPSKLFDLELDALFINNNTFRFTIPDNFANSTVPVLVLANNKLKGTLNGIILLNNGLHSCLHPDIGNLNKLTVFDISFSNYVGPLPEMMGDMESLKQLNVIHNKFSGDIPPSICSLPKLGNFTSRIIISMAMLEAVRTYNRKNCFPEEPLQQSEEDCSSVLSHPVKIVLHSVVQKVRYLHLRLLCHIPPPPTDEGLHQ
ncbi:hypothetical protein MKX01_009848 [Papaver californicum]|nr:hypothetical protein MKX01_009848 [Papaver californicum]